MSVQQWFKSYQKQAKWRLYGADYSVEWHSSNASNEFPPTSAAAKLLQWEPPRFIDKNSDILTKVAMDKSYMPDYSTGISVYAHYLVIQLVCKHIFHFQSVMPNCRWKKAKCSEALRYLNIPHIFLWPDLWRLSIWIWQPCHGFPLTFPSLKFLNKVLGWWTRREFWTFSAT